MGSTKSPYEKVETLAPSQKSLLDQLMGQAGPYTQQAASGYQQFLPGGGGGQALINQAMQRYQQQTIPSILNAYGSGSKGSSALNQALAASASNLNTDLAAMLAQAQLQASQGLGNIGIGQAQLGAQTPQFAYAPRQQPFWQQALLAGIGGLGQLGGAYLGRPSFNFPKTSAPPAASPAPRNTIGMGPAGAYPLEGNYNMYTGQMF